MEDNKKNIGLIIAIVLLSMIVVGIGGYVIYDKVLKDKDNNNENNNINNTEIKSLSITDPVVINLKYPEVNTFGGPSGTPRFVYKTMTLDSLERDYKMLSASKNIEGIDDGHESYTLDGNEIKSNYKAIFGPDTAYQDGVLEKSGCCSIISYDLSTNQYVRSCACGGGGPEFKNQIRLHKAELQGEDIYTYFYVQPFVDESDEEAKGTYLYKREITNFINYESEATFFEYVEYSKKIALDNRENEINSMMDKGEVDTYKFTFKKQSDGNYYFFSGDWL